MLAGTCFPKVRRMLLTSLLPLSLFLRPILKFWSIGVRLMRFTLANISKRWIFVSNFSVTYHKSPKMFRSGHDCTSTSSARSPCNFGSEADIAISALRQVGKGAALTPIPLLLAALKVIHEKNWRRFGVLEHFHLPDSP